MIQHTMCWCVLLSTTTAAFGAFALYFLIKGNYDIGSFILIVTIINMLFAIQTCLRMRAEEQIRHLQYAMANPMRVSTNNLVEK